VQAMPVAFPGDRRSNSEATISNFEHFGQIAQHSREK